MKPSKALELYRAEMREIISASGILNRIIFGSAVRSDDHEGSDLDLLITPISGKTTLFTLGRLSADLEALTHCPVDLCSSRALSPRLAQIIEKEGKAL